MASGRGLSNDLATLWLQAPVVIAIRLQQMWMDALSGSVNAAEMNRMISEKMMAAAESAVAVNAAMVQQGFAALTAAGETSQRSIADAVAHAAIKPYSKRVRSNVRRLSK
ncbi:MULTISPECIES: hypothetical protein [Rhizobium]|uniref:Phasin family protein n=1 Tax=Rhizobium tropici TaxID=398 RepID=A0A329Y570_RHITR|nr:MULTISPECIES: hypothetical protein [Rhizobium]MBB3285997.1 hypothetical protein [Rhizobium sp. BK252]MBB3400841.1 hypothetical protein [Rhizobium sp. BK289]MBB3413315.1 hypothetical protein [Rhizobium sp. BK284]MBB3481307.1 hypothetical protein [Rhizobium sp. BK347]MDK4723079.1 hypothetical protein [Rhizobium sp. CNPSo 3968]